MKKKIILVVTIIMISLCGCNTEQSETSSSKEYETAVSFFPQTFSSREELASYVESAAVSNTDITGGKDFDLLGKASLTEVELEGYTLSHITYRSSAFLSSYYIDDDYVYNNKYNEYENERLTMAIYEVTLFGDAEEALKVNHIDRGYEPITIGGKQYYYKTEYASNGDTIGYEFAFVAEDSLMYVHLPYTDDFKELTDNAFALDVKSK